MEFSNASFGSFRGQRLERHVALLSAEQELSSATSWVLELLGSSARSFETAEGLLDASKEAAFDLALCDLDLALPLLQSSDRPLPFRVVLMCPKRMDKRLLSTCIEQGATAYVSKPLRVQAIRGVLLRYAQEEEASSPTASKGNYERVRSLGSGSCGEVSLVRRCRDGRCFALKEVPIGYLGAAEQRRVLEELRLHKAFDCPFVVRYFTSWMQDDTACLLLEYVENGSLAAEVQRCRREDRQISDACIIDWASQIILGLLYLHRKEVVHRDLKMENLLGPSLEGCVKIADFGISKRLSGASLARSLVGTLEVMAPERVKALASEGVGSAPSEYGPESDLWSLGVVLYELALLHAPFSEDRADLSAQERQRRLIDRIQHDKPSPLPFSRAAVLHKVVIGGLLQKQPSQRPSAAELCQDPDLGRSIHHFLQKQKLLDHPSILEILDVLPSVEDPEGSFLASSLDVVTLRSHRSSLGGTGPFLDGARLSATELRKLLPEDLAEVFETAEAVDNSDSVPEPGQRLERKASKGPMAPGLSSTTSTASSPRPPPFPRPIPPRLGPDLAWPESMRGAHRRLKRPNSNGGEESRLPGAVDRNSVSSASSLPDLHQVLGSMVSLGSRESLPLSRRGSTRLDPLETTPKVRADSEDFLVEMVVGSPAGATSAALPGVARGSRCFTSQVSRIRLPSVDVERCQSTPALPRCVKRLADACTDAIALSETPKA